LPAPGTSQGRGSSRRRFCRRCRRVSTLATAPAFLLAVWPPPCSRLEGLRVGRSPCPCHYAGRWSPRAPRGCFRSSDGLTRTITGVRDTSRLMIDCALWACDTLETASFGSAALGEEFAACDPTGSQVTRRWSKGDSNSWSHPERQRSEGATWVPPLLPVSESALLRSASVPRSSPPRHRQRRRLRPCGRS
jgi:hypothetical protein